ncbi:MAG TPA: light-harvesting antenna LH1, beta subunit [Acetobacteraceae bacterium]|nr:light-harvesting antenna LH1, beta subunit [Acetobacteraceae bacterium]
MTLQTDSPTGLTAEEAQEFHKLFMQGFLIFTGIAIVAHFLVWVWRPWAQNAVTQTSLLDHLHHATSLLG